jgi:hypothetical protein
MLASSAAHPESRVDARLRMVSITTETQNHAQALALLLATLSADYQKHLNCFNLQQKERSRFLW